MKKILFLVFLCWTSVIFANQLNKIDYVYQEGNLIFSFDFESEPELSNFSLTDPFRIVVVFNGVSKNSAIEEEKKINDPILKQILVVPYKRNGNDNVKILTHFSEEKVYEIEKFGNKVLLTVKGVPNPTEKKLAEVKSEKKTEIKSEKKTEVKKTEIKEEIKVVEETVKGPQISKYQHQYEGKDLLFSIQLTEKSEFKYFHLVDPFRIVVDIKNIQLDSNIKTETPFNDPYLEKVVASPYKKSGVDGIKLILHLKEEKTYIVEELGNNIIVSVKDVKKDEVKVAIETKKEKDSVRKENKKEEKVDTFEVKKETFINQVDKVSYEYNENNLIYVIQLKDSSSVKYFHLTDPFRVVLNLTDVVLSQEIPEENIYNDSFIEKAIYSPFTKNGKKGIKITLHFKEEKPYTVDDMGKTILVTVNNVKKTQIVAQKEVETTENTKEIKTQKISNRANNENVKEISSDLKSNEDVTEKKESKVIKFSAKQEKQEITEDNKIKTKSISNLNYNNKNDDSLVTENKINTNMLGNSSNNLIISENAPIISTSENDDISENASLIKIGFRKYADITRISVMTTEAVQYETITSDNQIKLVLKNTQPGKTVSKLKLDTSYFFSAVKKIEPEISERDITVIIYLDNKKEANIIRSKNIIFVDFQE